MKRTAEIVPSASIPSLRCKLVYYCVFSTDVCENTEKTFRKLTLPTKAFIGVGMAVSKKTLGGIVLQLALALFLLVSGILTLQLDGGFFGKLQAGVNGNEVASAVHGFLKGDPANIVIIAVGICELIAGIFLLANFFVDTGKVTNTFVFIIIIMWIAVIALIDVMGKGGLLHGAFNSAGAFLSFLKSLSAHLLVLGSLFTVWKR